MSRQYLGKVKERSRQGQVGRQGQGKLNVSLKQSNNNHNHNDTLMGFATSEINLVVVFVIVVNVVVVDLLVVRSNQ